MSYPEINKETLEQWQETTNILTKLCQVPAALIMRQNSKTMEVMSSSEHTESPYEAHEKAPLDGELYCETVIKTQQALSIPNALLDPKWDHNPDIALGMISYYGVPINWPDGSFFGTLCVLDKIEKHISKDETDIINQFAKMVEISLGLLVSNQEQKLQSDNQRLLLKQVNSVGKLGHWNVSFETKEVYWSNEIYIIHGVSPDEYKPDLETAISFYHPDDIARITQLVNNALVNEEGWSFTLRIIRPDGEIRFVRSLAEISRDMSGEPTSIFGVFQDVTEHEELNKQVELLSHVANTSNVGVVICNKDKQIVWVNSAFTQQSGYELDEVINSNPGHILQGPKTNKETVKKMSRDLAAGNDFSAEILNYNKNGNEYWNKLLISSVKDLAGNITHFIGIQNDITEQKASEALLRENEDKYRAMFETSLVGMVLSDKEGGLIEVNQAYLDIVGYTQDEIHKLTYWDITPHSYKEKEDFQIKSIKEKGRYGPYEKEYIHKDGRLIPVILNGVTVIGSNNEPYIWSCIHDITEIKNHQLQLEHIAHYDVLTDLPNRTLLADRLSQAMALCNRHKLSLAVVFLDLDGFKDVNDVHGHDIGDELLVILSQRMKKALREGDSLARIGGDEFVAVLTDLTTNDDCKPVLDRLLLAASEPVTLDGMVLSVSASIGVTFYPQDNMDADQLMRHADQAMYVAKESGKNCYHIFDTAQDDAIKIKQESLEAIRHALDNNQFALYYQPKVNMKTGVVIGVEALIRWLHPQKGLLSPMQFLPMIENHSMSIEMGDWVIGTALTQISQWQKMGVMLPEGISVNIAAIQLQQPDFTKKLSEQLAEHSDVNPSSLELEILETSALEDVHHISTIMHSCMGLGVNFALDDFGTGYSSLTYLRRLPASLIKIDQSFIRDMLDDVDDLTIVEGVIGLAKSFKREVIAEGVETIEHGSALLQLGCNLAQGYGIARPMPANEIPLWIKDWKPDDSWKS